MPIITWKDEYNVNVAEIDAEHREMARLVNELNNAVEKRKTNDFKKAVSDLVAHTRKHFATEETLMLAHQYPDYRSHKSEHEHLLRALIELQHNLEGGRQPVFGPETDVSTDWVMLHIKGSDHALGEFLNSKNVY